MTITAREQQRITAREQQRLSDWPEWFLQYQLGHNRRHLAEGCTDDRDKMLTEKAIADLEAALREQEERDR